MRDRRDHKIQQLCRQVERHLSMVLAGEMNDPALDGLVVVDVVPAAGPSILQVDVVLPPDKRDLDPEVVLQRLRAALPFLRREVASVVNRKRTPQLAFRVLVDDGLLRPDPDVDREDGDDRGDGEGP